MMTRWLAAASASEQKYELGYQMLEVPAANF
jgi:hypothetical protein